MSRKSSVLPAKFLASLPKHQNLMIGILLANAFSLGLGILIGEQTGGSAAVSFLGSSYKSVNVAEVMVPAAASTEPCPVLGSSQISSQININAASAKDLDTLPGIGPVYAQKIIDGRPYRAILELVSRKIIPLSTYNKIKDKISVK